MKPEHFQTYLKNNIGKVVYFDYKFEWREENEQPVIGSILEVTDNGFVHIGHPSTGNIVRCGLLNVRISDISEIGEITEHEFNQWKENYQKFHEGILADDNFDPCEEDVENYTF